MELNGLTIKTVTTHRFEDRKQTRQFIRRQIKELKRMLSIMNKEDYTKRKREEYQKALSCLMRARTE